MDAGSAHPRVSVVIVNWNTVDMLRECLRSVLAETRSSVEVFVVDNASRDGSADMVAREFPGVCLIANSENRGFAAANNQALVQARGRALLLLNPDTVVLDRAIDRMLDWLDEHPEVGAVTCALRNSDGSPQKSCGRFYSFWGTLFDNRALSRLLPSSRFLARRFLSYWDHASVRQVDWARGAVLMVRRAAAEVVGLLDEQFYIYGEEIDWCYRLRQAGWPLVFIPHAQVVHHGRASMDQRRISMFIQNYQSLYQLLLTHYPPWSYRAYRARTNVVILGWMMGFAVLLWAGRGDESERERWRAGLDAYRALWRWHRSAESHGLRGTPRVPRLQV